MQCIFSLLPVLKNSGVLKSRYNSFIELMNAIKVSEFGDHNVLKFVTNLEIPKPKDDEVLIKVHSIGINPLDTYIRGGHFPGLPKLPWTPGSDCAGIVLEVGKEAAKHFAKDQRIYTTKTVCGAYASHVLAPTEHVHNLPANITFQQGAALGIPYYTAYNALFQRGRAQSGETILVHGASGGVGIATVQLAKAHQMTVIGTAGTEEGLNMIKECGADYVFNHRDKNYVVEMKSKFENKINIIAEMLADKNLVTDCQLAAPRGRIMVIGCRGELNFDARLTMAKSIDICGILIMSNSATEWQEAAVGINKFLVDGTISPVIGKEYPLSEASQGHFEIINNCGTVGKLVLNV